MLTLIGTVQGPAKSCPYIFRELKQNTDCLVLPSVSEALGCRRVLRSDLKQDNEVDLQLFTVSCFHVRKY